MRMMLYIEENICVATFAELHSLMASFSEC